MFCAGGAYGGGRGGFGVGGDPYGQYGGGRGAYGGGSQHKGVKGRLAGADIVNIQKRCVLVLET
eukprot:scaffold7018_cov18-Tisochrysis_lutea.AAC.3